MGQKNKSLILIILAFLLFVFSKFWEPALGVSSPSYGALATNILETGHWFRPRLAPGLFDPFVDHPYLVLWMDAIIFKYLGATAQTIRLAAQIFGVAIMLCLFQTTREELGEKAAVWACLSLLLVNRYMNFQSSGWLDAPMIGFVWLGYYFLHRGERRNRTADFWWGGLFMGLAVLAKGVAALATIPAMLAILFVERRKSRFFWASLASLIPILIFTVAHFESQGFLFWKAYLYRQLVVQNSIHQALHDYFWYVTRILIDGNVVTLFAVAGIYSLFRKGHKGLSILILGEILIHVLAYSFSSRHYGQYVIPVYPWLAMAAGFQAYLIFERVSASTLTYVITGLAVVFFVTTAFLPVKIHGIPSPFRTFVPALKMMHDNRKVYMIGAPAFQKTWEIPASAVVWYWQRVPIPRPESEIWQKLNRSDNRSIAFFYRDRWGPAENHQLALDKQIVACLQTRELLIVMNKRLCTSQVQGALTTPQSDFTR